MSPEPPLSSKWEKCQFWMNYPFSTNMKLGLCLFSDISGLLSVLCRIHMKSHTTSVRPLPLNLMVRLHTQDVSVCGEGHVSCVRLCTVLSSVCSGALEQLMCRRVLAVALEKAQAGAVCPLPPPGFTKPVSFCCPGQDHPRDRVQYIQWVHLEARN